MTGNARIVREHRQLEIKYECTTSRQKAYMYTHSEVEIYNMTHDKDY